MCDTLSPLLLSAMGDDRVTPYLLKLIGPDIEFLSAKVVYKDAKATKASPWHQDWFYWEGATKVSVWIALDDATPENGALMFVPGTHHKVFRKRVASDADSFQNTVDEADFSSLPQVTIDVKRGDAVFFHDLAIHGSHPNTAGRDRWSLITTYRDGSVADSSNVWSKSHVIRGRRVNFGG
jgi:ectoine hydroxylase-related dioxygenase (phytanoyl-CoA dioxygenase family)